MCEVACESCARFGRFQSGSKAGNRDWRGQVVARYYRHMTPNEQPKRMRRVILTMSCPPQLADRLDALVRETGRSGSEILRSALAAYLASGAST